MKRSFLLLVLLGALATDAGAAGPTATVPTMRAEATVSGEIVRLGDLIENAGPAAAVPAFHAPDHGVVEQMFGGRIEGRVDGHDVAMWDHGCGAFMKRDVEFVFHLLRQAVALGIVELHVEGLEPPERRESDAPGPNRADVHAFEVIGARDAIGDVPAAVENGLVRG